MRAAASTSSIGVCTHTHTHTHSHVQEGTRENEQCVSLRAWKWCLSAMSLAFDLLVRAVGPCTVSAVSAVADEEGRQTSLF